MHIHLGVLVIVEAGAAQLGVVERKAERLDQMQTCAGVRTQADDVAGVRRNFRFDENDIEHKVTR
ncbi:hypothetical protein BgramDRAFT_1515 [Paraburkholderia graminis C4D1M]|uniref:Uncharacterized protein n=1 Tax=Paraburkholderia graminis (strain ATCC 700544 / DSM 17151 / LMG 18924 / NCIMB 13744 / C4D1M) TaxID=396598 RepID=B1FVQ8_PARG4|nr:hypothetical protein BgramDRAFT_1515 [Paraburkholderia graminis C4D1M]